MAKFDFEFIDGKYVNISIDNGKSLIENVDIWINEGKPRLKNTGRDKILSVSNLNDSEKRHIIAAFNECSQKIITS